jgi:hypothetical protein
MPTSEVRWPLLIAFRESIGRDLRQRRRNELIQILNEHSFILRLAVEQFIDQRHGHQYSEGLAGEMLYRGE